MNKTRRLDLHYILCDILGSGHVYFQPPESVKLKYPCVIYKLDDMDMNYADDLVYTHKRQYTITFIDKDPDSLVHEKILKMPYCAFERYYAADNLNHWVYTLYY